MSAFEDTARRYRDAVEEALQLKLPPSNISEVRKAMAYSALGGGKRLRAMLVLGTCELLGGSAEDAMDAACAVEMLHAYSLIHDDLPCMDDAELRRGKPSCHRQFGEAVAVLAGDALLTEAFRTLAFIKDPAVSAMCARELSEAAGCRGMIYGQELDILLPEELRNLDALTGLNSCKTGALIKASVMMGYHCSGCSDTDAFSRLETFAECFGRAFQVVDDILDATSTPEQTGKDSGNDEKNDKATYVTLLGTECAYDAAKKLTDAAVDAVSGIKGSSFLAALASGMLDRKS